MGLRVELKGQRLLGVAGPRAAVLALRGCRALILRHSLLVTEVYVSAVEMGRRPVMEVGVPRSDCWRFLAEGQVDRMPSCVCPEPGFKGYLVEADCGTEGPAQLRNSTSIGAFPAGTSRKPWASSPVLFVTLDDRRRADKSRSNGSPGCPADLRRHPSVGPPALLAGVPKARSSDVLTFDNIDPYSSTPSKAAAFRSFQT